MYGMVEAWIKARCGSTKNKSSKQRGKRKSRFIRRRVRKTNGVKLQYSKITAGSTQKTKCIAFKIWLHAVDESWYQGRSWYRELWPINDTDSAFIPHRKLREMASVIRPPCVSSNVHKMQSVAPESRINAILDEWRESDALYPSDAAYDLPNACALDSRVFVL